MKNNTAIKVARGGVLFALMLVLNFLESMLTAVIATPLGVRLGLANTVVLFSILLINKQTAFSLAVVKGAFAFLMRGATAGLLSLCGGLLSFLLMALLLLVYKNTSILFISILGACGHNIGQIIVIYILMGSFSLIYMPVLLLFGILCGALVAVTVKLLLPIGQKTANKLTATPMNTYEKNAQEKNK